MKYLLVKPQGGLNDMLCQIEICCRYAEKFNRIVLVDTEYLNAIHFRDSLSKYFVSLQPNLILDRKFFPDFLNELTVFPTIFKNSIFDIDFEYDQDKKMYVETSSRELLSFDFEIEYYEDLLIHQNGGGGISSIHALKRMRLHDCIVDELIERLQIINDTFLGIHVRNTDYISNYKTIINAISKSNYVGPVLLCTDDANVIKIFKESINNKIISFTNFNLNGDSRLHFLSKYDNALVRNTDAIIDLLLLSLSTKLLVAELLPNKEAPNGGISGFSRLALILSEDKYTLKKLIGRENKIINKYLKSW